MKLRTSFFNPMVFRKNLTRFAPSWAAYSLVLLLGLTVILDGSTEYIRGLNAAETIQFMAVVNFLYALLNAQLLFGDLYNTRLCNALHAMPLRRECWFSTNLICGLAFALVPDVILSLIFLPVLGGGWLVSPLWLLGTTLQYLFFFGVAVFSVFLAGNRLAQVLVYGLINFLSILAYWFAGTLFEPLMYGVTIDEDPYLFFSPAFWISNGGMVDVARVEIQLPDGTFEYPGLVESVVMGEKWGYCAVCAILGIALLFAALALYRKRNLETAGDFMAVKAVEPVFLVLFTLAVGAFFQIFGRVFDTGLEYLFLAVGIAVGFYAGRMLLMRTIRVFQPKALLGLGGIALGVVLCLVLVVVDAFGIVRHIPKFSEVESISISGNFYRSLGDYELTEEGDIQAFMDIHRYAVETRPRGLFEENYGTYYEVGDYTYLNMTYYLTDGTELERRYLIPVDSEQGRTLKSYYTSVDYVLGVEESGLADMAESIYLLYVDGEFNDKSTNPALFEGDAIYELLQAVAADCKAGTMAQDWSYHSGEDAHVNIEMQMTTEEDLNVWIDFYIWDGCENTLRWMEENGFDVNSWSYGG